MQKIKDFIVCLVVDLIIIILLCSMSYNNGKTKARMEMIEQISEQMIEDFNVNVEVNEDAEN